MTMNASFSLNVRVAQIMRRKGWDHTDIVRRLGYKNGPKGHRHFEEFRQTGSLNAFFRENLGKACGIPAEEYRELLARQDREIAQAQEQERRERFRPYVYVRTDPDRPSQITIAALSGESRRKFQRIPEHFLRDDPAETLAGLHPFLRLLRFRLDGSFHFFGPVSGFDVYLSFDEPEQNVELSPQGEVLHRGLRISQAASPATATIKGKDLTPVFSSIGKTK